MIFSFPIPAPRVAFLQLIDSDVNRYTIAKLKKWKEITEQMAVLDLEEEQQRSNMKIKNL